MSMSGLQYARDYFYSADVPLFTSPTTFERHVHARIQKVEFKKVALVLTKSINSAQSFTSHYSTRVVPCLVKNWIQKNPLTFTHVLCKRMRSQSFSIVCFGGLGVACWPLVPKFAGSNPAEAVGFLRAKKSSARLPSEGK